MGASYDIKANLAHIKKEEVSTEETTNTTLLGHLDRKLGSLEQEQTELMGASYDIKANLTVQSEAQASLAKQLISKIGAFNFKNTGECDYYPQHYALACQE